MCKTLQHNLAHNRQQMAVIVDVFTGVRTKDFPISARQLNKLSILCKSRNALEAPPPSSCSVLSIT